jgi:hypothetical protein
MEIENRFLFFKYALPCAETLIKRKTITQEEFEEMLEQVEEGVEPGKGRHEIFKVAMAHLNFIAMEEGKNKIDDEIIREYFLFGHDEAVDDRFEEMGDFNQEKCRTYPGIVRGLKNGQVSVESPIGIEAYEKNFVKGLKIRDIVVVHRDFIVEKISKDLASRMWDAKKKYFPNMKKNIFS